MSLAVSGVAVSGFQVRSGIAVMKISRSFAAAADLKADLKTCFWAVWKMVFGVEVVWDGMTGVDGSATGGCGLSESSREGVRLDGGRDESSLSSLSSSCDLSRRRTGDSLSMASLVLRGVVVVAETWSSAVASCDEGADP